MLLNSEEVRKIINSCVYDAKKQGHNYSDQRAIFIILLYKKLKIDLECYTDLYSLMG